MGGYIVLWRTAQAHRCLKRVALMALSGISPQSSSEPVSREALAEHTHDLLLEAETADSATREQILDEVVMSHFVLAEALARRFLHRGEEEENLLQVACTGLVEASQHFDPHRGPFVSFAMPTIIGVLKRHFRDHGWAVRPPRPTQELATIIWRRWPALVQQMGSVPGIQDLATELGEPVGAVQKARFASQGYGASSIDAAMSLGVCFSSSQTQEDIDRSDARMIIEAAMAQLDHCERQLIGYGSTNSALNLKSRKSSVPAGCTSRGASQG